MERQTTDTVRTLAGLEAELSELINRTRSEVQNARESNARYMAGEVNALETARAKVRRLIAIEEAQRATDDGCSVVEGPEITETHREAIEAGGLSVVEIMDSVGFRRVELRDSRDGVDVHTGEGGACVFVAYRTNDGADAEQTVRSLASWASGALRMISNASFELKATAAELDDTRRKLDEEKRKVEILIRTATTHGEEIAALRQTIETRGDEELLELTRKARKVEYLDKRLEHRVVEVGLLEERLVAAEAERSELAERLLYLSTAVAALTGPIPPELTGEELEGWIWKRLDLEGQDERSVVRMALRRRDEIVDEKVRLEEELGNARAQIATLRANRDGWMEGAHNRDVQILDLEAKLRELDSLLETERETSRIFSEIAEVALDHGPKLLEEAFETAGASGAESERAEAIRVAWSVINATRGMLLPRPEGDLERVLTIGIAHLRGDDYYRTQEACEASAAEGAQSERAKSLPELRIVFDGPPAHESGRFVEVEDSNGRSVNAGEWRSRPDGLFELVLPSCQCRERSKLAPASEGEWRETVHRRLSLLEATHREAKEAKGLSRIETLEGRFEAEVVENGRRDRQRLDKLEGRAAELESRMSYVEEGHESLTGRVASGESRTSALEEKARSADGWLRRQGVSIQRIREDVVAGDKAVADKLLELEAQIGRAVLATSASGPDGE